MITKKMWVALVLLSLAGQMAWAVENNWFNTFVYAEITPDTRPISWMVTCSAIVSSITTVVIGATSDRWRSRWGRRKPFIFLGYILWGISTIIFPASALLKPVALAAAMAVVFDSLMSMLGSVGNDAALNAYVTDITDKSNRGRVQGVLQLVMWGAFLLTSILAGIVVDRVGYYLFFYILGGVVLAIGLIAGGPLLQEKPAAPSETAKTMSVWKEIGQTFQWESLKKNRELMIVFSSIAIWGMAGQIFTPYLLIYLINYLGLSSTEAGLTQAAALFIGGILVSVPLGRISDRWGRRRLGFVILIAQAVTLVLFSLFAKTLVTVIIFGSLLYIPITGWFINYKAWTRDLFPEDKRGQFSGITLLFSVLFPMVTGPFIGSWLTTQYGISAIVNNQQGYIPTPLLFQVGAVMMLLALIPLFFTKETRADVIPAEGALKEERTAAG